MPYGQGHRAPIPTHHKGRWQTNHAVRLRHYTLAVHHKRIGEAPFAGISLDTLGLLTDVHSQDRKALGGKILVQAFKQQHFRTTLCTPGCPEVYEDNAPP